MVEKYCNFVKSCSSSEIIDKESRIKHTALSGDEARTIYQNVINSANNETKAIIKTYVSKTCSKYQINKTEISDKDLFLSVQNNDIETLKLALQNCPDKINSRDSYGWSLLMIACQANNIEVVEELLKHGADTSVRDKAGNSARSLIIKNKNYRLAEIFLSNNSTDSLVKGVNMKLPKRQRKAEKIFCDICKIQVDVSKDDHLSSTIHNINLSKGKEIPTNYIIPKSNRGYQMMIKVGWDKKSGLGPDGSGNKYPIKAVQKKDRKGLGHSKKPSDGTEKSEGIKFKNKRIISRESDHNRKMEVNFRRQFY